jgi:hypothetical protein
MLTARDPAVNLDREWRVHMLVVPARLGCDRGIMYDFLGAPREGCVTYSDDGYPAAESAHFGSATDMRQRDVPRAYLRSAIHEITHTFNQIHQELEGGRDNSIMTSTPAVADVLAGLGTGAPGVFPDQIDLAMNPVVRNHLVHMPDPIVRPGGWPFNSWRQAGFPQATNRAGAGLRLTVAGPRAGIVLGSPVELAWTLTNDSGRTVVTPGDITLEGPFTSLWIVDDQEHERPYTPVVAICESAVLGDLADGASVTAAHRLFWGADGFAFPGPGRYRVVLAVRWVAGGEPVTVGSEWALTVTEPATTADREAAELALDPEVGLWVALGGDAYHLGEATKRLAGLARRGDAGAVVAGFSGLLPESPSGR